MTNTTKQAQMTDEQQRQFDNELLRLIQQHFPSIPLYGGDADSKWSRWLAFARACSNLASKQTDAGIASDGRDAWGDAINFVATRLQPTDEAQRVVNGIVMSMKAHSPTIAAPQPSGQPSDVPKVYWAEELPPTARVVFADDCKAYGDLRAAESAGKVDAFADDIKRRLHNMAGNNDLYHQGYLWAIEMVDIALAALPSKQEGE